MDEVRYILGIDQGSSKTHVIIGDETGRILGLGTSYGAYHHVHGMEYPMKAVKEAAEQALKSANVGTTALGRPSFGFGDIAAAAAGITGIDWDFEKELLRNELNKILEIENIITCNDCIIAMRAGTKNSHGAIICAGSGLNCAVRGPGGEEFIYGFYVEDDYQGGSSLGYSAVVAVINADVGISPETLLTKLVLEYLNLDTAFDLLFNKVNHKINGEQYLHLPVVIAEAARLGDKVAKDILYRFGSRWGMYIERALKRMSLLDIPMEVVLSGGIFKCSEPELRNGVTDSLASAPLASVVDSEYEPIVGAYLLGADSLNADLSQVYSGIEACADEFNLRRK